MVINFHLDILIDAAHGTAGLQHVTKKEVQNLSIPLPPLEEQKRIAGILNKAEEIKKLREEADKKTEELIPAIFHEMFGCLAGRANWVNDHTGQHGDIVSGVTKNCRTPANMGQYRTWN